MHRFLVSAAHKSSGKTTVATGLAAALRARGLAVQPFKKGPDYIDPMWLTLAAGRACRNLDFHLSSPGELTAEFHRHARAADVALVEGNKGLYDGLDLEGRNSNAALARLLGLPVVLVLDARGMTRGVAPLILGYQAFDREVRIAGVILNRLGGSRHEAKLRAVIEHYTDVPVVGAVAEDPALAIVERHLGLVPPNEAEQALRRVERLGERISAQVDLDALLALSAAPGNRALPLAPAHLADIGGARSHGDAAILRHSTRVRVAIARDRAFGFYYADDLEALEAAGARIVWFDTLSDDHLPPADALFIGGGFPECSLEALAANRSMRESIRRALAGGLPAYAECGGLMYLARSIAWRDRRYEMVGAIAADVTMHERPVGRGYVELCETGAAPWPGACAGRPVPAHEFHYSSLDGLTGARFAWRVERGHGIDGHHDGLVQGNLLASYSHLRSTASHDWAARFVAFARQVAGQRVSPDAVVVARSARPSRSTESSPTCLP